MVYTDNRSLHAQLFENGSFVDHWVFRFLTLHLLKTLRSPLQGRHARGAISQWSSRLQLITNSTTWQPNS